MRSENFVDQAAEVALKGDPKRSGGGPSKPKAVVLGAGVSGLTTAFCLQDLGFEVDLVAEDFGAETPSVVAGALWELPPAVCGFYESQPPESLARETRWSLRSYRRFLRLAGDGVPGVYLRPVTFYFRKKIADLPHERRKMADLRRHVRDFRQDPALVEENGVAEDQGFVDAYSYLAPQLDMQTYLSWLQSRVLERGAAATRRTLSGSFADVAAELRRELGADVLINATGLGSGSLGDPAVLPVRGALIQVHNDGRRGPRITAAHCTSLEALTESGYFIFILPRRDDRLWLGGLAEPEIGGLDLRLDSPQVREMHRRCVEFMPILEKARLVDEEPLRVGLRPFRRGGPRVEAEASSSAVHNYGHGGAGVLLSWGCAGEAAELARRLA